MPLEEAGDSLNRRRRCVDHTVRKFGVSERLACWVLGQHRSTQRKAPKGRADDAALTADIIELATRYGCSGYPPGQQAMACHC
jgi:putative transposase